MSAGFQEMQLFGCREREAIGKIETHLVAEDRDGPGPGAVALFHAVGEDAFHQIVILPHGLLISRATRLSCKPSLVPLRKEVPCQAARPQAILLGNPAL